ncbi:hypothetical protein ABPG75_000422 [Micractinium tetrahymenae]
MLLPVAAALILVCLSTMLLKTFASRWAQPAAKPTPTARKPRSAATAAAADAPDQALGVKYVPWEATKQAPAEDLLIVDCTHSSALTITHHKAARNPPKGASDCSTGLVLDALALAAKDPAAAAPWLARRRVSVNHFDADAVLSMWVVINRQAAPAHAAVLRHAARIGDLREAGLGSGHLAAEARRWDGVESEEEVHHALKLCCWMNTIERTRFSPPYVDKDSDAKHQYFLERLAAALTPEGIEALRPEWEEEYAAVLEGWALLEGGRPAAVQAHPQLGLAVLRPPRPLHYYSLFSHALGADTVLTVLPGQRYEVESRYTQFVNLWSRPVQARLDMAPLAAALNRLDTGREAGTEWASSSMVDTGPILRLDRGGEKLSKAQRYGHPTDRPHFRSGLPPAAFEAAVASFLLHGLVGTQPKLGGWSWDEMQELNQALDWAAWEATELPAALAKAGAA